MTWPSIAGLFKANSPQWVWIISPLWFAPVILAVNQGTADWTAIALFLVAVTIGMGIAEFAGTYSDREEDRLYGPTNPLVTGELDAATARKAFILQNVLAGALGFALMLLTRNYALTIVMILGWFIALAYSLPPLRFKETLAAPFFHGLGIALLVIFGWLVVAPLSAFAAAFAGFLFVNSFGFGVTMKFRKTLLARDSGLVHAEPGSSIYDLSTVGLKIRVRTATAVETIGTLGAFALVPVFWHLGIFNAALSILLLALPLPVAVLAFALRFKDPVKNGQTSVWLLGLSWILVILSLLAVAVASLVPWGFAALACVALILVFSLLVRIVHPWGCKSPAGRERPRKQAPLVSLQQELKRP